MYFVEPEQYSRPVLLANIAIGVYVIKIIRYPEHFVLENAMQKKRLMMINTFLKFQ